MCLSLFSLLNKNVVPERPAGGSARGHAWESGQHLSLTALPASDAFEVGLALRSHLPPHFTSEGRNLEAATEMPFTSPRESWEGRGGGARGESRKEREA